MFEGDKLAQPHGGNVQVLHEQHAPNRDVEQPNNAQIENEQPNIVDDNVVENEQPNIAGDNADLQIINQHDVNMELEGEQASSKSLYGRLTPLCTVSSHFLSKVKPWSDAELHNMHPALIVEFCDEEPLSLEDALACDH